ncbi:MAG: hypothetical protein ABIW47_09325 [Ginsengibacter sp.]
MLSRTVSKIKVRTTVWLGDDLAFYNFHPVTKADQSLSDENQKIKVNTKSHCFSPTPFGK